MADGGLSSLVTFESFPQSASTTITNVPGKTLKPCKREGGNAFNKSCCNYATNLAGANLTGIMKVMVMANHLGQG